MGQPEAASSYSSSSDEECPSSSYVPLLDGPHPPPHGHHTYRKELIVAFCGLLLLVSFVAFNGYNNAHGGTHADHASLSTTASDNEEPKQTKTVPLRPAVSHGVSAGVSEKANLLLGGEAESYNWSNTMLSWQRTAYHFQPEKNWMNDPNGPMYYKGWYHFFYQYNPNGAVWGDIVWGHAVSRDMIHWLHLPLAMVADQWYDINGVWTGSATILPDGQVMMLYTGSTNESVQVQNLAYPADPSDPLLVDWIKYHGNPVLFPPPGIDSKDFRDPTTAWLTSEGKWRISIGSKINKTGIAFVYDTEDFKTL